MIFITKSDKKTQKLGEKIARNILKKKEKKRGAFVIALKGDLGGGKTTFLQGFAKGLGVKEKILSPTFVILKRFKIKRGFKDFYHMDCYRVKNKNDLKELGLEKMISNPENIVAVEWPEKAGKILPKNIMEIEFEFVDGETRKIRIDF